MSKLIPVKDNKGLARDPNSKAIVSVDSVAVRKYHSLRKGRELLTKDLVDKDKKLVELEGRIKRMEEILFGTNRKV